MGLPVDLHVWPHFLLNHPFWKATEMLDNVSMRWPFPEFLTLSLSGIAFYRQLLSAQFWQINSWYGRVVNSPKFSHYSSAGWWFSILIYEDSKYFNIISYVYIYMEHSTWAWSEWTSAKNHIFCRRIDVKWPLHTHAITSPHVQCLFSCQTSPRRFFFGTTSWLPRQGRGAGAFERSIECLPGCAVVRILTPKIQQMGQGNSVRRHWTDIFWACQYSKISKSIRPCVSSLLYWTLLNLYMSFVVGV